jgi:hypothetical protein
MTYYLKFESEEQMSLVLSSYYDDEDNLITATHDYAVDVIGTIFQKTSEILTDHDGDEYTVMEPTEGWHVNWKGDIDNSLLEFKIDEPATPHRVFAGNNIIVEIEDEQA